MTVELSADEARRLAVAAQGFADARPKSAGLPQVRKVAQRLGVIQIDSVSVLVRTHYLPSFSRLGPHPLRAIDTLAYERRELFEYNGHQASLLPMSLYPLMRWRMEEQAANKYGSRGGRRAVEHRHPGFIAAVEREVSERGPMAYTDLEDQKKREPEPTKYAASSILWWNWSDGKWVMDMLAGTGVLAVAGRRGFQPVYDLAERVIPAEVLARPGPPPADAKRELVHIASRALGIATVKDLSDYYRMSVADTRAAAGELVEDGHLLGATVEGWKDKAYLDPAANVPKSLSARAVVSPFDSLVWNRPRTRRIFGFDYRIEIYVPAPKRVHGYYVLPFLLGDQLVGRVDLKRDSKSRTLLVPAAFVEPGRDAKHVAGELAAELGQVAGWLGLDRVEVGEKGTLARPLARALR